MILYQVRLFTALLINNFILSIASKTKLFHDQTVYLWHRDLRLFCIFQMLQNTNTNMKFSIISCTDAHSACNETLENAK